MAERIKGLQIDLSMRDMGVSKTLAGIKREFRSLNSSLKLSSNNFKYGEKSASSYKTRMNDLDKSIKVGTSNLNELEKQYKQVAQSQGANSAKAVRLQTEYNKQATAINAMKDEYGRLNQYYRENFSMAGRLSNSFRSIGTSMQGVGNQAQNMGRSLTSSITKPALVAGTAMAGITAKLGFDRLVGLDSAKAKLEGLGYSTKEVGSITDQVSKAIEGGMTTMAEGTDVAAGALAAGVKEGKDLEKYIKLVGDAAVGSNRPVGEMAMIFNRVQGQGKLMTQELNMVEEGMPGFSNAMAKHLGVSYDAFREMVTNGEVSSKEFLTVMDDFAGGMANSYAKSWKGMVQNTKAYIGILGENLLSGVFEQSKDGLREFEKLLQSPAAQKWAKDTGEQLGNAFSKIAGGIKSIINWWQSLDGSTQKTLGGIVKWLAITLVTMGPVLTIFGKMASTIGGMFSGMSSLIQFFIRHNGAAKVSAASQAIWNGVTATARGIANGYRAAMTALTTSQTIQAIKTKIAATAMTIWTGVTKAAALATRGLGLAIRFMTGPVGWAITAIGLLVAGIVHLWKTNSTFRNIVMSVWQSVQNKIMSVVVFVTSMIRRSIPLIKVIFSNTFNGVRNIVKGSLNIVMGIAKVFSGLFTGNFRKMWSGVQQIFSGFIRVIKGIFQVSFVGQIVALARSMGTKIKALFANLGKVSRVIFSVLGKWMSTKWQSIKDNTVGKAKLLWSGVKQWWSNLGKNTRAIMNFIGSFISKKWQSIKNGTINKAKLLWSGVKGWWSNLSKNTRSIMNSVGSFMSKKWQSIKAGTVNKAKSTWSGVKNWWSNLSKNTRATMSSVGKFMSSKWSNIKTNTVNRAKNTWSGVKGAWGSLSKGTRNTMNSVGGFMSKKWRDIKNGTVDLATGLKNKVTGVMNKMGDAIKSVTGNIKGFFTSMIDKVKGGLNKLIDGVNWVGGKLNMDKLPKIKLHTGTEHTNTTTNVVKNGKIARDTFATVGDKGRGNGPGGFRHEAIRYPNGKMAITPNRDTTAFLPKGSSVMNGAQTHSMLSGMPRFANGTLSNKKPKKKKKGDNVFGDAWDASKAGAAKVVDGGKAIVSKTLETAAKGKDWLKDKVGDVMDWIEKPGKLLNKVLEAFGVNMEGFGIPKAASLPFDMMKGMFSKLKKAATDLFTKWMEEQGGGDGGYIDLSKGINFGFARTAAEAARMGYPFPRAHHGLDINYKYDKVYSTLNGMATAKKGYNGGFGNMVSIKSGALEAIYGHLHKLAFSGSKKVKPGTYLGISGGDPARDGAGAGSSTGPHLHYEMRKNGVPFDPRNWLKKNNGGGKSGKWSGDVKKALKLAGLPTSSAYVNAWKKQIQTESGGNPKAMGGTDGLADGAAKGLVQVKPGTFNAYKLPGHGNIWNGLDNLIAGMRYAKARYGKGGMLGVIGKGHGYATGGLINSSGLYNLAEGGYPEWVIPTDPSRNSDAMKLLALAAQDIDSKNKRNKRPNQMRIPSTSNNNDNEMINFMARQLEATQRQVELLTQLVASNQRLEQKPTGVSERDVSYEQGKRWQMQNYNLGGI
ncbi:phage tail tape measure protein [Staphylococcus cohnii]|nr:phage tail tape measure protein [Staphylococcus cohnii]